MLEVQTGKGDPVFFDGDPNETEMETIRVRAERNHRLAESDPMLVSDRGLTDAKKAEWVTYRQALRDMDFSDLDNITWPTKPN